jgi:GNAT superfamily N-acetyltransferase
MSDDVAVGPLARADVDAAGAVLARSHRDDPAFAHILPGERTRLRVLRPLFRSWVADALPFGAVRGVKVGGRLAGVAVWLPSSAFPPGPLRALRGLRDVAGVLAAGPRSFPGVMRYMQVAAREHPSEAHLYLEVLGLDDGFRGRGLGPRLLAPTLGDADRSGLPCYLETAKPANVPFYERLGFVVTRSDVPLVRGGPTHWLMWRDARSRTTPPDAESPGTTAPPARPRPGAGG